MNSDVPIHLHPPGVLCALGDDLADIGAALFSGESPGMQMTEEFSPGRFLRLGKVTASLPDTRFLPMPERSRNNALLLAAFARVETAYRRAAANLPPERVAVVIGTSASGMFEAESAVRTLEETGAWPEGFHYAQQELGSPAKMLAGVLGVSGPAYAVSTACTSSAKALISGARLLKTGLADLVLAGGVDTLTRFTVAGFSALGAVAPDACLPFSRNRQGINIGEAAALFLLTREAPDAAPSIMLAGWGESSDGYHVSAPDPSGAGAKQAITAALNAARVSVADIDYVNLHGTATPQNDAMENRAVAPFFPATPMSSTKPLTGHALGAAGALEAALCWLTLVDEARRLPPHLWDEQPDPALAPLRLTTVGSRTPRPPRYALSTSFAFGGSNVVLILGRGD
ncbi:MAG: beta-ketoacyl-ACP synthase [Zoogloeaceae bacterium]|jgi:3-oxoacyl-[acyl-carrier-protein] synthase-1|nr:beta-ketoacyl-ACP synthase [Zoogloeaceae bacterium]